MVTTPRVTHQEGALEMPNEEWGVPNKRKTETRSGHKKAQRSLAAAIEERQGIATRLREDATPRHAKEHSAANGPQPKCRRPNAEGRMPKERRRMEQKVAKTAKNRAFRATISVRVRPTVFSMSFMIRQSAFSIRHSSLRIVRVNAHGKVAEGFDIFYHWGRTIATVDTATI